MNLTQLKVVYGLSLLLTIIGAYLKIIHAQGADEWLIASMLAFLLFLFVFISHVNKSPYLRFSGKVIWAISFVFVGWLTALLYLIMYRKSHYNV